MALHSYLPQDRLQALARGESLPERTHGAAVFVDIAGFTALTEALTQQHGERGGIESLSQIVGEVHEALTAEIERQGGATLGFAGDAVTCWFDSGPGPLPLAAARAVACALAMQRAMRAFGGLALKVCVASGPARRFTVGDPQIHLIDVLAGATLSRVAQGDALARPGDVLLDAATRAAVAPPLLEIRSAGTAEAIDFGVLDPAWSGPSGLLPAVTLPRPLPTLSPAELRPWVLPFVFQREVSGQGLFVTDLRPAVAVFLGFDGPDYDVDDGAAAQLDSLISQSQRVLQQHGGVLLELVMGDKGSYLYGSFGAAQVHEDDARRAVRAAFALRSVFADVPGAARIGLASGTMRVGGYGSRSRQSFGAQGDAVNAAARLMGLARPGEILASGRVRAALASGFAFEARPAIALKGKADPMPVFALLGPQRTRAIRLQEPEFVLPLVGRDSEMQRLAARVGRVLAGHGEAVAVVAEAGMGKSRLIAEGLRLALRQGLVGYGGSAAADGVRTPYRLWHGVWTAFFDLDPALPSRMQLRAAESAVARRAPDHAEAWPLLGAALGLDLPDNAFTLALAPKDRKALLQALLLNGLCHAALEAAQDGSGLVLVLEDVHNADPLSHELLAAVVRAVAALPVLVLMSQRPPESGATPDPLAAMGGPEAQTGFVRLELAGLEAVHVEQLIRAKLAAQFPERGGAVPQALIARIVERAQGNPFYIEELLNYLHDRGLDPRQPASLRALDWPVSLRSLVLSRIDRLSVTQQLALKVASVLGRRFRLADLHDCHPWPGGAQALADDLHELAALGLTPQVEGEAQATFVFGHLVTLEVAYESIAQSSRMRLHGGYAAHLEARHPEGLATLAPELAHHWARAERRDKAWPHLLRAGEQAASGFANDEALASLAQALQWLPVDAIDTRVKTLLRIEAIHDLQGSHERRRSVLAELHALACAMAGPDATLLDGRIALRRAALEMDLGDFAAARQGAQAALAMLPDTSPATDLRIDSQLLLARALFAAGLADDARAPLDQALALARTHGHARGESSALAQLGVLAWQAGRYDDADTLLKSSLPALQLSGDLRREIDVLNNLGVVARSRARFAQAVSHFERAQAIARRIGDRSGEAMLINNMGVARLAAGDFYRAVDDAERAARIWAEIQEPSQHAAALANRAEAHRELGQYAAAQALSEQALDLFRSCGMRRGEATVLENLGRIALALGRYDDAMQRLQAALAIARDIGLPAIEASTQYDIGRVHLAAGRLEHAAMALGTARQQQQALGDEAGSLEVQAAQAELALAQGGPDAPPQALAHVSALLPRLAPAPADSAAALPMLLYAAAWRVLVAADDPRAEALRAAARLELRERSARIPDPDARRTYLDVTVHRLLLND
jgi:class 3 adenylate cyclase/tetratricopeptide (TPR) repeat protein